MFKTGKRVGQVGMDSRLVLTMFRFRPYTVQGQAVLLKLNWQCFGKQCLFRTVVISLKSSVSYSWSKGTGHFLLPATNTPGIVSQHSEGMLMFGLSFSSFWSLTHVPPFRTSWNTGVSSGATSPNDTGTLIYTGQEQHPNSSQRKGRGSH